MIFFPSRRIQWHFLVFVLLIYVAGRSVKSPSGGFVYPYTAEGVRVSRQIVELGTGGRVFHFLFSARTGLRSARGTSAPVINSWSGIPDFDFPDVYRRGSHAARAMSAAVFRNWYERSNSSVDITLTSTVRERYFSLYCRYFFEMIFFFNDYPAISARTVRRCVQEGFTPYFTFYSHFHEKANVIGRKANARRARFQ